MYSKSVICCCCKHFIIISAIRVLISSIITIGIDALPPTLTRPVRPVDQVVFAFGESNVRSATRAVAPGTLYQFSGTPLLLIGLLLLLLTKKSSTHQT